MSDLKCPHCGHKYDHDGDFEGLDMHDKLNEICPKCDEEFYCYVEFNPVYSDCYKPNDPKHRRKIGTK